MLNLALSREIYYHLQKNINESSLCLSALMAPLLLLKVCVKANKTYLKSCDAATSYSVHFKRAVPFCCHGEERTKKKKKHCPIHTLNARRLLSAKGMWCSFRAFVWFCVISFEQELQQQLVIETRNLKKTRNFYQKLIQQERKNKGWVLVLNRRRSMKMAKCCVSDTGCKDCVCVLYLYCIPKVLRASQCSLNSSHSSRNSGPK